METPLRKKNSRETENKAIETNKVKAEFLSNVTRYEE